MTDVADALGLVQRGWPVFPGELSADDPPKKVPIGTLVERGFKDATLNHKRVALWWKVRPDAIAAVAMPRDTVALDVDDVSLFEAAGLELPDGPGQQTPRGGYHRLFRTDGRPVRQTVKEVPGADTRVGGRGYVFAWQPGEFPELADLPMAPEWLYGQDHGTGHGQDSQDSTPLVVRRVRKGKQVDVTTFPVGERDNALAREAGFMRQRGFGPDEIFAVFKIWRGQGRIESPPSDPMTDKDLQRIAGSIGTMQSDAVDKQRRPEPKRYNAETILDTEYKDLVYYVEELVPEGLGIIGGASKIGKSWMVLQAAMEVSTGGLFLDRKAVETPVLYYALEDGPRRAKSRMQTLKGARKMSLDWLEWRFEAPMLGEGLEDDIERFIVDNHGGIIFVDVLAMVQPEQRGRGSAYNADYSMLRDLHSRLSSLREDNGINGATVFTTHLRKQGAEDPYAMLQGTTGILGVSDWTWIIKRARMDAKGSVQVTGRDIVNEPYVEAVFNGAWTAVGTTHRGGSKQRNVILDALLTEGDQTAAQIRAYANETVLPEATRWTNNSVSEKLNALEDGGLVERTEGYVRGKDGGIVWHALTEDEITATSSVQKGVASAAERASGHGRALPVRRVGAGRAGARERAAPHPPQAPHLPSLPMVGVVGVEGALQARTRTRGSKSGQPS